MLKKRVTGRIKNVNKFKKLDKGHLKYYLCSLKSQKDGDGTPSKKKGNRFEEPKN